MLVLVRRYCNSLLNSCFRESPSLVDIAEAKRTIPVL